MANEIKLITFADSEVTATDDAYVYESAIGEGGVINGCEVTIKNASELHINGGNGVLCGRKFTVYDSDLPVTLSSSGTLLGRLYIHMDLSNASTPIQLMIETGASLTPVQQDADVNATNGVYEINLSTFNVDTSTISDLVDVSPKVYPHEVLNTIEECVASTNPGDIAGASAVSELNSNLSVTSESLGTNITIYRIGKMRFLIMAGCVVGNSGKVVTVPNGDIPASLSHQQMVCYQSSKYYSGYVVTNTTGDINARYYIANSSTDGALGTGGAVFGTAMWFTA